jgi:small subunit ribosomal protein S5
MAEKENVNQPKDLIEAVPEEIEKMEIEEAEESKVSEEAQRPRMSEAQRKKEEIDAKREKEKEDRIASWVPKTKVGLDVKSGKEKDIDHVLKNRRKILEPEIVDYLIRTEADLLSIGQAKGKFGGGKRRAWRQTQKKTKEGNVLTFSAMAVVGDKDGHIGIGYGRAKETLPAREKAIRKAKLNITRIERGCGNFDCSCSEKHSIPAIVEGKAGSVRIKLIPAPQGTGLVVGDECKKILRLAGIKDVYSVTTGGVRTTFNLAKACIDALNKTGEIER